MVTVDFHLGHKHSNMLSSFCSFFYIDNPLIPLPHHHPNDHDSLEAFPVTNNTEPSEVRAHVLIKHSLQKMINTITLVPHIRPHIIKHFYRKPLHKPGLQLWVVFWLIQQIKYLTLEVLLYHVA